VDQFQVRTQQIARLDASTPGMLGDPQIAPVQQDEAIVFGRHALVVPLLVLVGAPGRQADARWSVKDLLDLVA
jgi:hypothetical protein